MNGRVLTWAREQSGITAAQLASSMGQDESTVVAWEQGREAPTLRQLETIAAKLKRPLAVFFFSQVPSIPSPKREFRMLPDPQDEAEARDTSFALREAHARQLSIVELAGGTNPAGEKFLFADRRALDPGRLRRILAVSLDEQRAWTSAEEAFKRWRERIEQVGVFVFKRSFEQASISGFCLPHAVAPVIVVNNGTTFARQVFTLFHELCHLAHHHHGVTRADHDYLATLGRTERIIEAVCNRFAASFLVPNEGFAALARAWGGDEREVESIARRYNVSREVILRRLLDHGRVSSTVYDEWTRRWNSDYFARPKPPRSGGNHYATTASYLGPAYLRLAFSAYLRGEVDLAELAEHLGVKARQVAKLEPYLEATG